ncbi:uncharacterized protein J4E88_010507 [Alternaria novae-zelandiae]|uniref:uncharacterized protein n=1 Tax=Alternaria novae-zelandiae TaxID=430562 RepID=UPI0020C2A53E|nr:uncharacterized protein J4E88_010507 [Alternaria novae-zelandiae]KAI4666212.1 hypothetical protein J4E88_010507 [Alternaria novae-zelandiae]
MNDPNELEQLQAVVRRMAVQSQFEQDLITKKKLELEQTNKAARANDVVYQKYLRYYAMKDCLRLVNLMHQKLPVELRDLVYEFLCVEPDRPIPVGPYYHFRRYDKPFHDPLRRQHYDGFVGPTASFRGAAPPAPYRAITGNNPDVDVKTGKADDGNDVQLSLELTERIANLELIHRVDNDDDDNTTVLPDGRVREEHTHKPPRDMPLPSSHFLDPRYVGAEAAYEIQKIYYGLNTFSICSVERAIYSFSENHSGHNIVGYDDEDGTPWEVPEAVQTKPLLYPRNHIRNLQVRLKFEQFDEHMQRDHLTELDKYSYERRFLRFTEQNLEGLGQFLRERSKHDINIEFVIMSELPDFTDDEFGLGAQCNYVNFLQSIRNWVYIMKYDCDNISVKVTHHDPPMSAFPRDISGLFGLTQKQWEQEKAVHQDERAWVAQFYLAIPFMDANDISFGYPAVEIDHMLRERWGMDSITATEATLPITEGRYWPSSINPVPLDRRWG